MYFHYRCPKTRFSVLLSYFSITLAQVTELQTIFSLDAFSSQKPCAQDCFTSGPIGGCFVDVVGDALGCVNDNVCGLGSSGLASNNCYCRTDLQSVAESFLTSCVRSACTAGDSSIDISSAGSIYGYYCSSQGYPAKVTATTTQESSQAKTTEASFPTSTNSGSAGTTSISSTLGGGGSSTNPRPSGSSLSLGAIIAIAVVPGLVLLSVICCIIYYLWRQHKKKVDIRVRPINLRYEQTNPSPSTKPPQSVANWSSNVLGGPPAPPSEYPESDFFPSYGR